MAYYRLIKPVKTAVTIQVAKTNTDKRHKNMPRYGDMTLQPNKIYSTDGDVFLETSLKNYREKKVYSKDIEETLKAYNIPYEVKVCPGCGGGKRNIFFNPVEVFYE